MRKQQKNAPIHIRRRYISAPLSPNLKTQYGARTMPIIEEDTVTITKGDRKLTEGKVLRVNTKNSKVYIEGVTRTRLDGSTVQLPVRAENVMITKLKLDDDWRKKILERKGFKPKEE
ncbi:MAG: 50S ribosomal protein L24 [Candidatus Bathyarchaeota archaeon]|nr:50S ribosomal protein L24 [Candidatus Bathyarchaeota archaeon]